MLNLSDKLQFPWQACLVILSLVRESLAEYSSKCTVSAELERLLHDLPRKEFSIADARALAASLDKYQLPTDDELANDELAKRAAVASLALRVAWDCVEAMNEVEAGRIELAWRAVSAAALQTGFVLALAAATRERRSGGLARAASDPKQEAKTFARELWEKRELGLLPKLRTVEQFAAEVMRSRPVLTSAKVICGWSAKWTREARSHTPAS